MNLRLILSLSLLLVFISGCVRDPKALTEGRIAAVERGLLSELGDPFWKRMDLSDRMEHYNIPGISIAVINDFQIEWAKGYGFLAAGGDDSVTQETLFQAASLGKPVVAVATLHYVERGDLDLDRDVNRNLISWQVPENKFTIEEKVTLRRLLSHNAGVTIEGFRGYALGEEVPDLQQILNGEWPANSQPILVDTEPGTMHRYSGGGYVIVQKLLEDVISGPFPDIMHDTVLAPWGMSASTFESPLPEELRAHAASGHRVDGVSIPGGWHTYPEMGSGASMWSTPSDIAQFAIRVMQSYTGQADGVLSRNMAIQMLTPKIENRGLGPLVYEDGGDLFYFMHPGANDGYKSVLVAYPLRGQGIVIMTNSDNGDDLWREILNSVSVEYGWVKNYTLLFVSAATAVVVVLSGFLALRRTRIRSQSE